MLAILTLALAQLPSPIKADEEVIFFPTYASVDPESGDWIVNFHGWIYEPETDDATRKELVDWLAEQLGLDANAANNATFRARAALFLVDNEGDKRIEVQFGPRFLPLEESGSNGHFAGTFRLSPADVEAALAAEDPPDPARLTFKAVTRPLDDRVFTGRVELIEPDGVSIVSDIDDTIKQSDVLDVVKLLENTFLHDFAPVPGMAELYGRWSGEGARFHYVSASPWQLYSPLAGFLEASRFPPGTFEMKLFRVWDESVADLIGSQVEGKLAAIEPILAAFPCRRFVLVGDSGEQDPEIYGELARRHPEQVRLILIRDVTNELPTADRYTVAFEGVPPDRWRLFDDPSELQDVELP